MNRFENNLMNKNTQKHLKNSCNHFFAIVLLLKGNVKCFENT